MTKYTYEIVSNKILDNVYKYKILTVKDHLFIKVVHSAWRGKKLVITTNYNNKYHGCKEDPEADINVELGEWIYNIYFEKTLPSGCFKAPKGWMKGRWNRCGKSEK